MQLAKAIGRAKAGSVLVKSKEMNEEQLRGHLVGVGNSEKIAKKVAELVFEKK